MAVVKNAMEVFNLLDKSNCRKCGEKTCLAFAGAVFMGKRRLQECPKLENKDFEGCPAESLVLDRADVDQEREYIAGMIRQLLDLDLALTAQRVGARLDGEVLNIPILGKTFGVRRDGTFSTDLHTSPWLVLPLLDYVLHCKGLSVGGDWMSFREIAGGREKYALFKKRGENVLKALADKYTDFFNDIVHMFNGKMVEKSFESDVSVVLYPLPLVPMMICYWKPEEGLDSSLNLFFDKSVGGNLGVDSTFTLGTGIARMFEKLAEHHAF